MLAKNSSPVSLLTAITIATLCILICVTSCTNIQAQNKPPMLKDDKISAYNRDQIIKLEGTASGTDTAAQLARNKLIAITVEQVDTAFNEYRKKTRKRTDTLSFIFDVLEIGASTAISIVGGARSKALVGEGLSFFQGSRSAFNKDFRFLERQLLFDKMVAKRSDKLAAIYGKLSKTTVEYPWEQARSELRDYFFAGTIDEALSSLSRDTGAEAQTAEKKLIAAKIKAGILGAPSEKTSKDSLKYAKGIDAIAEMTDKAAALKKFQSIYSAIETSPASELFDQIPDKYPLMKAKIEASLTRLREKDSAQPATFDDYNTILHLLNGVVESNLSEDPSLYDRLLKILDDNK